MSEYTLRVKQIKSGQIYLVTVMAGSYDAALEMVQDIAQSQPNLAVLGM